MLERVGGKLQTASTGEGSWARGGLEPPLPQPQSGSQPVEGLGWERMAAPAASAKVYQVKTVPEGWGWAFHCGGWGAGQGKALSLGLDPITEHKVRQQPQGQEEDAQDQEVHVELGVLHIQRSEDTLRILERAVFLQASQVSSIHAIDGQNHTLKAIPRHVGASEQDTEHRVTCSLSIPPGPSCNSLSPGAWAPAGAGGGGQGQQVRAGALT